MNNIIENLIEWCYENKFMVNIDTRSNMGGHWVIVTLKKGDFRLDHYFYIAGGVFRAENWRRTRCNEEVEIFLEEAREHFEEYERAKETQ